MIAIRQAVGNRGVAVVVMPGDVALVAAAGPGAFSLDGLLRKPGAPTERYSQA